MNHDELVNLVKTGESETTERKLHFRDDAIDAAGAFANKHGGIIIIGVSNEGEVKGVAVGKETLAKWSNKIAQSTDPRIVPDIEQHEVEGKHIVVIRVTESPLKPVEVKGRYLKRVGEGNQRMTPHEIAQMHLRSVGQSWDKLPAPGTSVDDVDLDLVKRYVQQAREVHDKKVLDNETPLQVLEKMELVKKGRPTWAALLLFQKRPQRYLSQASVHCGRFKDKTVVIDDSVIEGTIIEQITATISFIRKNTKVRFVITGAPAREEVWEYPLDALREAIINAVCHRDYTIPSHIEVRIYDDELVVWSPGRLPVGVTVEDLYKNHHASVLRNKGISEVFYDIGLIEKWGRGTVEMRKALIVAGLPEPRFEEYQHGFQVVFRTDIYTEEYLRGQGLNERQIAAVMFANKEGRITNKDYQELNAVSNKTAYLELSDVVKKGIFALEGSGRNVTYSLKRHMTREAMQRVVDKELEHIPKGDRRSPQNELRMAYNMLRWHSLGSNAEGIQTKEVVLRRAIKSVRGRLPSFTPQYDSDYFKC